MIDVLCGVFELGRGEEGSWNWNWVSVQMDFVGYWRSGYHGLIYFILSHLPVSAKDSPLSTPAFSGPLPSNAFQNITPKLCETAFLPVSSAQSSSPSVAAPLPIPHHSGTSNRTSAP